jgi:hypothetical protein
MKVFGVPDADPTAYHRLLDYVQGRKIKYVLHYTRVPIDARPCLLPQSLRVQAVMEDGSVVTSVQAAPGRKARIE